MVDLLHSLYIIHHINATVHTPSIAATSSMNTPPPPTAAATAASSTDVRSDSSRPARRIKRHAGSSLANDDSAEQRMRDTIRRRFINSPPKSIYKSPTPRRPPSSVTRNNHANLPAVSLSFNTDINDGAEPADVDNNVNNNVNNNVFRDSSSDDDDDDDCDDLVSAATSIDEDEFYASLETQPNTQDIMNSPESKTDEDSTMVDEHNPSAGADATYSPNYEDIPRQHRHIINQSLRVDHSIVTPHEFQVQTIHRGAFYDNSYMHVIAKTGFGKSVIPLAIASLRHGVAVVEVPLIGLGSDQVAKAVFIDNNIEAYHVDEHKFADAALLKQRLLSMTDEERKRLTVVLYLSPQCLSKDSQWTSLLKVLAEKDYISLLAVDEAHYVSLHGTSFRPEFVESITTLREVHDLCKTIKPPRIVMSATLREADLLRLDELFQATPDFIIWTEMNRRRIFLDCVASGSPTLTCSSSMRLDLRDHPDIKIIWYTNSKKKAQESMVPSAENNLDKSGRDGEAMACTGDCGIMEKSFLIAAFRGDEDLFSRPEREELADTTIDDELCEMPNLKVMCATEAANCGISSKLCRRGYRNAPPANMYTLVQEMGRMDRDFLYHSFMERYFKHDTSGQGKIACGRYCSYCTNGYKHMTGVFRKKELIQQLSGVFLNGRSPVFKELIPFLKSVKGEIFEPGEVADSDVAPLHALALQLVAKGIIDFDVKDDSRRYIGTNKLVYNMVTIKLGANKDGLICYQDQSWSGLRFVECATTPPTTVVANTGTRAT